MSAQVVNGSHVDDPEERLPVTVCNDSDLFVRGPRISNSSTQTIGPKTKDCEAETDKLVSISRSTATPTQECKETGTDTVTTSENTTDTNDLIQAS